jgi:hypothetical protein
MPIKLNTASGGGVILTGANTASDKTITVPAVDGTMNMSGAANEVPAGSASAPAIYPTGDTNTGIFFPAADTMAFAEGGVESARIDSSGNLLVNTTSLNSGEKMSLWYSSNTGPGLTIRDTSAQNGNTFIQFRNGTTTAGSITSNGSTTMTYGSASDYRLKENLTPLIGALAKIASLQPKAGNWKADGSEFVGFVAHELQEVFPDAVVGEKDKVDADGNPLHQMVDTGSASIIATLAAAIQEQQQMIETLQAKVAALEAK